MKKPEICPCCGKKFDEIEKIKIHGPYKTGPYIYVCHSCWEKEFLYFPDKKYKKIYPEKTLDSF